MLQAKWDFANNYAAVMTNKTQNFKVLSYVGFKSSAGPV
jgi:hypothetical protein